MAHEGEELHTDNSKLEPEQDLLKSDLGSGRKAWLQRKTEGLQRGWWLRLDAAQRTLLKW